MKPISRETDEKDNRENNSVNGCSNEKANYSSFFCWGTSDDCISMRDCVKDKVREKSDNKSNPWIRHGLRDCGGDGGVNGEKHDF